MRRLWRVLEILLVCGTFAGASTLGTLAVLGDPKPKSGAEGVVPFGNTSGLRTRSEIAACLSSKGMEIIAPELPTPADATALAATLPSGDIVLVVVFGSEAAADAFHREFVNLQPPDGLILELGHVLVAYTLPPDAADRADVEGCVLGETFEPPPEETSPAGNVLDGCLIAAGFEVEDITEFHELPVRSLRVAADATVFVFLFDSEARADQFQEVYGPDQVVHDLGLAVVEYENEPAAPLAALVEGCIQAAGRLT